MTRNRHAGAGHATTAILRRLALGITWLVAFVSPMVTVPAQDGSDGSGESGPTAAQRRWVQQLGDAAKVVRDKAEEELARQGSSAKGVLTEALKNKDAEIRWRARLLLNRLLDGAPDEAADNQPADNQPANDQPASNQPADDQPADPVPAAAHRELVQQLGDRSYFTRQQATEQLASLGAAAEAALTEALQDPDLEIRFRARRILNNLLQKRFEARLAAFIMGGDEPQHGLPGWRRFRELVGDRRETRRMFADMARHDWELLSAYEAQVPELPDLFSARVAWLLSQATNRKSSPQVFSRLSLSTLLLIGCDQSTKIDLQGVSQLYQLLCQSAVMRSIGTRAQPPVLRTLLEKWATGATTSGSYYGMSLALKYNLEEAALEQAKKMLAGGARSSSMPHNAIVAVGRFGGAEHIPLLTPQLENKTVCHRWSNRAIKKNGTIDTQVRDVALVVLLRLSDKDPAQYGFRLLQENPETLYHAYTFGFVDNEEREAAHAKWAAESKADAECRTPPPIR